MHFVCVNLRFFFALSLQQTTSEHNDDCLEYKREIIRTVFYCTVYRCTAALSHKHAHVSILIGEPGSVGLSLDFCIYFAFFS